MIDPDSPVLAYIQVANDIADRIARAELAGRLPAERELAAEYGVAYGTIRRAMEVLRERGLVESVHGRGTFVRRQD
jgi:GntR family transcriptional regulator